MDGFHNILPSFYSVTVLSFQFISFNLYIVKYHFMYLKVNIFVMIIIFPSTVMHKIQGSFSEKIRAADKCSLMYHIHSQCIIMVKNITLDKQAEY